MIHHIRDILNFQSLKFKSKEKKDKSSWKNRETIKSHCNQHKFGSLFEYRVYFSNVCMPWEPGIIFCFCHVTVTNFQKNPPNNMKQFGNNPISETMLGKTHRKNPVFRSFRDDKYT